MQINPYFMFSGQTEEALNFYAKALNGQIVYMQRYGDSPMQDMHPDKNKIMHATFRGQGIEFMAADTPGETRGSGVIHLSLNCESLEEQEKVFNGLAEGGTVTLPLQDTFWGAKFGMLTDKYGINWMFNYDTNKKS